MADRPVTIRTFDLGADKVPHLPSPKTSATPVSACAASAWRCAT